MIKPKSRTVEQIANECSLNKGMTNNGLKICLACLEEALQSESTRLKSEFLKAVGGYEEEKSLGYFIKPVVSQIERTMGRNALRAEILKRMEGM